MIYTARVREHVMAANRADLNSDPEGKHYLAAIKLPVGTDLNDPDNYPACYTEGCDEPETCEVCSKSDAVQVAISLDYFGFGYMSEEHLAQLPVREPLS